LDRFELSPSVEELQGRLARVFGVPVSVVAFPRIAEAALLPPAFWVQDQEAGLGGMPIAPAEYATILNDRRAPLPSAFRTP
jgi:hypothetical protein